MQEMISSERKNHRDSPRIRSNHKFMVNVFANFKYKLPITWKLASFCSYVTYLSFEKSIISYSPTKFKRLMKKLSKTEKRREEMRQRYARLTLTPQRRQMLYNRKHFTRLMRHGPIYDQKF